MPSTAIPRFNITSVPSPPPAPRPTAHAHGDTCSAGACVGAPYTCDDGLECTIDSCVGDGTCTFDTDPSCNVIDLVVSEMTAVPASVGIGERFQVSTTVTNQGTIATGRGFYLRYYLSADETIGYGDTYLGRIYTGALDGSSSATITPTFTMPLSRAPGAQFVVAAHRRRS